MKYAVLLVFLILAQGIHAQPPKSKTSTAKKPTVAKSKTTTQPTKKSTTAKSTTAKVPAKTTAAAKPKPAPTPTPTPLSEKEQYEKASTHELATDRVAALEKFLVAFPESENRLAAADLLTSSRELIAEEKLLAGDAAEAVKLFRLVIAEAPQPIPDELFKESIAKIPSTLFRRGQREAALDIATAIEEKVENNTGQLLELANFYIGVENGGEAMRVAAKAVAKDPTSAAAYRTLALAHRINFDIEEAANAYAKALELEPGAASSTHGLAEMKRALGKSDEAAALFRDLLAKNESDVPARTGLVLALFDAGKRSEAETELAATLEKAPGNVVLLAGAAYWYASRGIGAKAVELAEKALAREPRYIWSHIALARGLIAERKPVAAEQVLVKARAYGNFPTLEYELASARMSAGFYREAVEDLSRHFTVSRGGVKTFLGGRVSREEKSLFDLVAYERKASIMAPVAADTVDNSELLRALLELDQKLNAASPDEAEIGAAADAFVKGNDKMKLHRQLHAASLLLQKRVAAAKVLELTKAATGNTDTALDVPAAGAAVMASELYESRATAFRANDFLVVPEVPRQTLSAILRGRIEELAGWALYLQGSYPESIVRLRRSITVMPDKSAWWRSSLWRLGAAQAADGKEVEALNSYIESYKTDKPDYGKYAIVESLYRKVHGSTEGLEAKIGVERVAVMEPAPTVAAPSPTPAAEIPATTAEPTTQVATPEPSPAAAGNTQTEKPTDKEKPPTEEAAVPARTEPLPTESKPQPTGTELAKPSDKDPTTTEVRSPPVEAEKKETANPAVTDERVEAVKTESLRTEPSATEQKTEPSKTEPPPTELKTEPAKTEPPPTEQKTDPPKTEPAITEPTSEPAKPEDASEKPPEKKAPETTQTEKPAAATKQADNVAKPLFEPIIITIPRPKTAKTSTDAAKTAPDETKKTESETKAPDETKTATTPTGEGRPRVIEGQEVKLDQPEPCKVGLSQESVSVINDGGKVGVLVHVEAPGDAKRLTAISSSPKDVEVSMEPEISGIPDRRFFVIKSLSAAVGVYQVAFATPCGKKDLIVTVR